MRRKRAAIEIGYRAAKEIWRLFDAYGEAREAVGCGEHTIREWEKGVAPSALYLARLHELGADVIWILTGKKSNRRR